MRLSSYIFLPTRLSRYNPRRCYIVCACVAGDTPYILFNGTMLQDPLVSCGSLPKQTRNPRRCSAMVLLVLVTEGAVTVAHICGMQRPSLQHQLGRVTRHTYPPENQQPAAGKVG